MHKKSSIASWVTAATKQLLDAGIVSARLDAELIMSHTIRKGRTYLHAHGEEEIDSRYLDILDTRLALRLDRVPIAYIIGHKDFYGRRFKVTPATLIPRPESETMIDFLKEAARQTHLPLTQPAHRLIDVGTGSGCLGITAKLEIPELDVTLSDTSRHALTVAEENAARLRAAVTTLKSNLLQSYPFQARYILANLPYVSQSQEVSPETQHEPAAALFAEDDGLLLIFRLLDEAPTHLTSDGILLLEAEPRQHERIIAYAKTRGFTLQRSQDFIVQLSR